MQNSLMMKFVGLFIISTILKVVFNMFVGGMVAMGLGVVVDAGFLVCVYMLLRQYRVPSIKRIMIILILLMLISILTEFGILPQDVGNLLLLAVFAWMIFGKGGILPRGGRRF